MFEKLYVLQCKVTKTFCVVTKSEFYFFFLVPTKDTKLTIFYVAISFSRIYFKPRLRFQIIYAH